MKKALYLLTLLCVVSISIPRVFALDFSNSQSVIPSDPALRKGVLKNGLTYYIRHNALPKGQADFYILSDVGAIQEEEDQQGLAHFLEHLAFNGTKSMPSKEIIDYLESIGVKFGTNLNAATSWDYTIYMMKDLPLQRPNTLDSALLILHEWAGHIDPKEEEINKERGVIKEELRTRDGADWRSTLSLIGALGRGTKYEERNLIGYLEGLDSFESEALLRFYHNWYTPNHQAIIIVGDVDVDQVEAKIKKQFKRLPAAKRDAPKKEVIEVESNPTPLIEIYSDKELQYSQVQYFIRRKSLSNKESPTIGAAKKSIEEAFISIMQNDRLKEVVMSPNAPILSANMGLGRVGVIPTMEATIYSAQSPDGGVAEALRKIKTEMERTKRYGFLSSEVERAREELMSSVRSSYLNRADRTNNSFIDRYVSNYRFAEPTPSAEMEWEIDSTLIASTTLASVNERTKTLFTDDNQVVMVSSPERDGLVIPTQEELLEVINEVASSEIAPYEEEDFSNVLLPQSEQLVGSEVIAESVNSDLETTEWRLKNGITVVVRPSLLKSDEVILTGYSAGGASQVDDEEYVESQLLSSLIANSGVGEFSAIDLQKVLSGKRAALSLYINEYSQGVRGRSTPADLETLLQLLYLNITSPRLNAEDLNIFRRRLRSNYENQASDPDYLAAKRYAEVVYGGDKRRLPLNVEMIDSIDLNAFKSVHSRLFSDSDNLRFTIAGNVDLDKLRPLVERYIGSLPVESQGEKMAIVDRGLRGAEGIVVDNFEVEMEQPKVGVNMLYWGEGIPFSLKNRVVFSYFKAALDELLLNSVREELGGTYGVSVGTALVREPFEHYRLTLSYDTNEVLIEKMQETLKAQIEKIASEGVEPERMDKTREFLLKSFGNSKEHNSGLIGYIESLYVDGFDYINDYEATLKSVTSQDVQQLANQILNNANKIEVIMHPSK